MTAPLHDRDSQLEAVIRTAQYLAALDSQQNIWEELGKVVTHFLHADLAAFAAPRLGSELLFHVCEGQSEACSGLVKVAANTFRQVLQSGFLATESVMLEDNYAIAFLPLNRDGRVAAVMAIGHRGNELPSRDSLNLYLAVAGLFSSTLTRLSSQHRFLAMADNVPEMLFQLIRYADGSFQFSYVSPGARTVLRLAPEELMGDAQRFLAGLKDEDRAAFEEITAHGEGRLNRVFRWLDKECDERHLLLNAMPSLREEGSQVWDGAVQDVTEHERLELEHKRHLLRLEKSLEATVEAIASTIEMRDPYTAGHQRRVVDLAQHIAAELGMSSEEAHGIALAASIHDIGKIHVPGEILSFPGKLGAIEFELVKTHPQIGYEILKVVDFPWPVADMVLQHHERLDGSGYPKGLRGASIIPGARIIAVADVVESIASYRPYRPALSLEDAFDEISLNRGVLYDPDVVDACLRLFREKGYQLKAE